MLVIFDFIDFTFFSVKIFGNTINPFLYGETSISNIAKRYPVNYFFKTLIFILSITLFLYWKQFNSFFPNNSIN